MSNIYITNNGDQWDLIAKKIYGSEVHMDYLIKNNLEYIEVFQFKAGVALNVPPLPDAQNTELTPAWRR